MRFFVDIKRGIDGRIGGGEAVGSQQRWDDRQSYFNALVDRLALHLLEARAVFPPAWQATARLLLYRIPFPYLSFYNRNAFWWLETRLFLLPSLRAGHSGDWIGILVVFVVVAAGKSLLFCFSALADAVEILDIPDDLPHQPVHRHRLLLRPAELDPNEPISQFCIIAGLPLARASAPYFPSTTLPSALFSATVSILLRVLG